MTNGKSAAAYGKSQIGKSYDDIDCIRLVVLAIRNGEGAGGESKSYQCGGTNELWRSLNASGKYRYVTRRLELETAKSLGLIVPGALLTIWEPGYNQKYDDFEGDCSHIGIYVGDDDCEVVHSSATKKCVAASTIRNGWTHVLVHRLIDLENGVDEAQELAYEALDNPYTVIVDTDKDPLTIRDKPTTKGNALGKVKKGGYMTVVGKFVDDDDGRGWLPVEAQPDNRRSIVRGWAAGEYLKPVEDENAPAVQTATLNVDCVIVPRDFVLALADAVNVLRGAAAYNAADYLNGVETLLCAAEEITRHLKGDD